MFPNRNKFSFQWLFLVVPISVSVLLLAGQSQCQTSKPWNQVVGGGGGGQSGGGGLQRSFSTGDIDQIGRRRRPGGNGGNHNNNNNSGGGSCQLNYEFDYFVLAIQWPKSFCVEKQECDIKIAKSKKWLIHGLWPNRNRQQALGRNKRKRKRRDVKLIDSKNGPSSISNSNSDPNLLGHNNAEFCCGPRYNSSLIKGQIYRELLDKWPTLHPGGRHHSFWSHEWQKHGTCARQIRPLQTQLKYFETILGLYNQFDLNSVPIQSGRSYKLSEVHQLLEPRIGNHKVRLECSLVDAELVVPADNKNQQQQQQQQVNSNNNRQQQQQQRPPRMSIFSEVHICLDKQLRPMDCPHRDDYQCKRSILFP